MFNLTQTFREALEQGQMVPVVVCDFDLGSPAGTHRIHNYPGRLPDNTSDDVGILSEVSAISRSIDPVTRKVSSGALVLSVVDDGTIRDWGLLSQFLGARVRVSFGFAGVPLAHFVPIFTGAVDDISTDGFSIDIKLQDLLGTLSQKKYGGAFVGKHPLEVAHQLILAGSDLLEFSDLNASDFDPVTYSGTISHFNMTSVPMSHNDLEFRNIIDAWPGVPTPDKPKVDVHPILDEICQFLQASIMATESGQIRVKLFDGSAEPVRTLTRDDYAEVEQKTSYKRTTNKVAVSIKNAGIGYELVAKDDDSIATLGERALSVSADITAPVAFTYQGPYADPVIQPSATLYMYRGMVSGFTGLRGTFNNIRNRVFSFAQDAQITSERAATFAAVQRTSGKVGVLFCDASDPAHPPAVVHVQLGTYEPGERARHYHIMARSSDDGTIIQPLEYEAAIAEVRYFGQVTGDEIDVTLPPDTSTEELTADALEVCDLTIVRRFAEIILSRFSRGAIELGVTVSLRHIDLELGDIIALETDVPFVDANDFSEDSQSQFTWDTRFEIVGKEIDITGSTPSIRLELVQSYSSSKPIVTVDVGWPTREAFIAGSLGYSPSVSPSVAAHIAHGVQASPASGLTVDLSSGVAVSNTGGIVNVASVVGLPLPESSTNWIQIDAHTGALLVTSSDTGETPSDLGHALPIATVTTGAVAVSSVRDRRVRGAVAPMHLMQGAIPSFDAIRNGSFEAWTHGPGYPPDCWGTNGTWTVDGAREEWTYLEGSYAVRFPASSTLASAYLISDFIPTTQETVYLASASMRQSAAVATGSLKVFAYDQQKNLLETKTVQSKLAGVTSWSSYGGAYTSPTGASFLRLLVQRDSAGSEFYCDNVKLELGSPMFAASLSADVMLTGQSVVLVFDTEHTDRGGWYDNTTGHAKAPVSGDYSIKATVPCFKTNNSNMVYADLYVGGVLAYRFGQMDTQHHGAPELANISMVNLTYKLGAGDLVHIQLTEGTGLGFKTGQWVRAIGATFSAKLLR